MTEGLLLALGILTSSFLGSWHCGVMCSPIATLMRTRGSLASYHLGRMISYVLVGVLAGALGSFFLNHHFVVLRKVAAALMSLALLYAALTLLFSGHLHGRGRFSATLHRWLTRTTAPMGPWLQRSGLMVGLLTVFLPCGWLYTYVAAALATQSPVAGGAVLFLFWLGGLPALSAIPLAMNRLLKSAPQKRQKVAGYVLLVAALYSVWMFWVSGTF